jgi:hypothetical protein
MSLDVFTVLLFFCFLAMLFCSLSWLGFHRHAHGPARRHAGNSRFHTTRYADPSPGNAAARQTAYPSECPLCDKRCILAQPRCKRGEAFVQFMRADHAGDPQTRTL